MASMLENSLGSWKAKPDGTDLLPEYRKALLLSCVMPYLMAASPSRETLQWLGATNLRGSYEATVKRMVATAFQLPPNTNVEHHYCSVPAMDVYSCVYSDALLFYNSMGWERKFLHAACQELSRAEDASGLQIVLAYMSRGARECTSRKRAVFSTIINRVKAAMGPGSSSTGLQLPAEVDSELRAACSADHALAASCQRLVAACTAVIHDMKDRAFDSVFLQSTAMYATLAHDDSILVDTEVHGAPTFLAMLQAATGIKTSRLPELTEEAKGIAHALGVGLDDALDRLWADENLGRSWSSIKECKSARLAHGRRVPSNACVWLHSEGYYGPKDSVRAYAAKVLLPRLFTAVTASSNIAVEMGAGASGSADGLLEDLQRLFMYLKQRQACDGSGTPQPPPSSAGASAAGQASTSAATSATTSTTIPPDCDDVRYWVYDVEAYPPVFNTAAARLLFSSIGVVQPEGYTIKDQQAIDAAAASAGTFHGGVSAAVAAVAGVVGGVLGSLTGMSSSAATGPVGSGSRPSAQAPGQLQANLPDDARASVLVHSPRISPSSITLTAAGDIRGGGTGREHLRNLHNDGTEGWNKWLHPGYVTSSWVRAKLDRPYVVTGYAVCSANDSPHRDPVAWRVTGKGASDGRYVSLHVFSENGGSGSGTGTGTAGAHRHAGTKSSRRQSGDEHIHDGRADRCGGGDEYYGSDEDVDEDEDEYYQHNDDGDDGDDVPHDGDGDGGGAEYCGFLDRWHWLAFNVGQQVGPAVGTDVGSSAASGSSATAMPSNQATTTAVGTSAAPGQPTGSEHNGSQSTGSQSEPIGSEPVTEIMLEITAVRHPGDCLQLGHWHLYGRPA